jgi:hypothetical protein
LIVADPWADIAPSPTADTLHLRRADAQHPLDVFRGRDHLGRLVFSFQGKLSHSGQLDLPSMTFMEIDLLHHEGLDCELLIRLLDQSNADTFRALCEDLFTSTEGVARGDDSAGFEIILNRLQRWQDLLRSKREDRLSRERIVGLVGELLLLKDVFVPTVGPQVAIAAWRGPLGAEQDFVFRFSHVEVKTQVSTEDSYVQVASEHQLDAGAKPLVLCHQTLGPVTRPEGSTLAELIDGLRERLRESDPGTSDRFNTALALLGYQPHPDYNVDHWLLTGRTYFDVSAEFPKLTPAMLSAGVERVRYRIRLADCHSYRLTSDVALNRIFGFS